ncbi:hypothetical protein WJX84_002295 [Apatococcus fuscideae]|uniref:starch synthase n=1 Tax=Apatococcus fuscideae TaxID=2026836 RepID=A0AAW1T2D6_9CHLO
MQAGRGPPSTEAAAPSSLTQPAPLASTSASAEDEAVSRQFEQAKAELAKRKRRRVPPQTETPMDIVFVAAEAAPWSKTGGLGDVMGSLPIALAARGHRVMVVVPRYLNGVEDQKYAAAKKLDIRVDWVFVDHAVYHRKGNPYADEHGAFGDNVFRYSLLSMAACEAPLQLNIGGFRSGEAPGFPYGQRCLFMANDWHASLVPAYLAGKYRRHGVFQDARCILAIHNMAHQGVEPAHTFSSLGLPDDWFETLGWEFPSWSATPGPAFNILKGGILAADRVVPVSQGYAWEMTTAEGGWGLDGILKNKQHVLNGVVNGIDMLEWDPSEDEFTAASYSTDDLSGKARCKAALQKELGLKQDPDVPLLGYIGRLDWQKGPDAALDAVEGLAHRGCQTIMLGSGVPEYEQRMRQSEQAFPDSFRGWVGFSIQWRIASLQAAI